MKKIILVSFLVVFLTLCVVLVGGYFYLNLIFIPYKLIPLITEQAKSELKTDLKISHIYFNPRGQINIIRPIIYNKEGQTIFLQCKTITASTIYRSILDAWKKDRNILTIPLEIKIKDLSIIQDPITITGNIGSRFIVKVNLKNTQQIGWQGNINLEGFAISGIPAFGDIKNINGTVSVTPYEISSSDIEGSINKARAKLSFKLIDFSAPQLDLTAEFTPLTLNLRCSLRDKELRIENFSAEYNQIKLKSQGQIKDIETDPIIIVKSKIDLDLKDLNQLPLQIKTQLAQIKPSGKIQAQADIQGPVKTPDKFAGNINIRSEKFSLLDCAVNNLNMTANFKDGKFIMQEFTASVLDCNIEAGASCNLLAKNLPYSVNVNLEHLSLVKIKEAANLTMPVSGSITSNISIKGEVKNIAAINLSSQTEVNDLNFEDFTAPSQIVCTNELNIIDLKDIRINKFSIYDDIFSLDLNGKISDFAAAHLDLTGVLDCKIENLKLYKNLQIPEDSMLNGTLATKFKINGPASYIEKIEVPFQIQSDQINVNQFTVDDFTLQGLFKAMKIDIRALTTKAYGGQIKAGGFCDLKNQKTPIFKSEVNLSDINMAEFANKTKLLPADFKGLLSSNLILTGEGATPQTLTANAKLVLDLTQGSIKGAPLQKAHLSTSIDYQDLALNLEDLTLIYEDIELIAKGRVDSLFKNPNINLSLQTNLDLEDLDKVPVALDPKLKELKLNGILKTQIKAHGPISDWTKLELEASLLTDQLRVKGVSVENIDLEANLHNKLLNLTATANSYRGTISASVKADFLPENFTYQGEVKIDKIDLGQMIKESKIIQQPHEGIASLEADFKGTAQDINTIVGTAKFQLSEAKLSGLEILNATGRLLGIAFLSNFKVTQAHGTFKISDGYAHTEDTTINGPDANISAWGKIYLDQNIDLTARLILSEASANQTQAPVLENFFTFENNQYYTELDIKGTLSDPQPNLSKFIREKIQQKVKTEIKKVIFKQLEGFFKK